MGQCQLSMVQEITRFRPRRRPPASARAAFPLAGVDDLQQVFDRAQVALSEPFRGFSSNGDVRRGLYSIQKTGVSTQALVATASAFLACLTPEQQQRACFPLEASEWRQWSNIHPFLMRHGQTLEELTGAQRAAALELVRASLSGSGYSLARNIMRLNEYIGEICGGRWEEYGEWLYWISIFGSPSPTEPWGWQIDGHHLIVNCFVLGDQIVMTPTFMGSEPVTGESGKWAGIRVLQEEEQTGYVLMSSLTPSQQDKARIGMHLPFDGAFAAFRDNLVMPNLGISCAALSEPQRALVTKLVQTYTGRMRPGHAELWLEDVKKYLPETWFAWIGPCDEESAFYYRVSSPVVAIEFDHRSGIALDQDEPSRDHIHTVVRTPNGNDYGKDLLRLHYQTSAHHRR
jgi:hypothetical protein